MDNIFLQFRNKIPKSKDTKTKRTELLKSVHFRQIKVRLLMVPPKGKNTLK